MSEENPKLAEQIPAEGNNIASAHDRAHADMPDPNLQPPVEKISVSPPDVPEEKEAKPEPVETPGQNNAEKETR